MTRKRFIFLLTGLILLVAIIALLTIPKSNEIRIGIFQIADHPALDNLRTGFKETIENSEWARGKVLVFDYKNANGDGNKVETIAAYFANSTCKVVYTIGTSCAQALKRQNANMHIILGAATDPVSSNLITSWNRPGGVITGTTDLPPVEKQLSFLHQLLPAARRIGIIYNTGEDNSVAAVSQFRSIAAQQGLVVIERSVATPAEIATAVASLFGKVDVIYAPPDNTVQSGFVALHRGATDARIPVFNCDLDSVKKGALFSVGVNYHDIGIVSGNMALEVLNGQDPSIMAIRGGTPHLYLNEKVALEFKVNLPERIRSEAKGIVN